jgi:hypothetical protein
MKLSGHVIAAVLLLTVGAGPSAQTTASPVPVIVELFTSEGCSSCPPADQLLSELVRTQPVKNALIIGLGEHVDYWDHQGWRDPFSSALFSARQSAYAAAHRASDEVYTPQMIVDGTRVFVGQDRAAALDAIGRAAIAPKAPVQFTWTDGASLSLHVRTEAGPSSAGAQAVLAIIEDDLSSSVTRGENSGRHLTHSAVVRQLAEIGRADARGVFDAAARLKLDATWRRPALHAVVFLQRRPLGAITAIGITNVR